MAFTAKLVSKTSIKYNRNSLKKINKDEKETIDIELTEQKADSEIIKMLLTFDDQMYKEKRNRLLALTWLRAYKSKLIRNFSKNWLVECHY